VWQNSGNPKCSAFRVKQGDPNMSEQVPEPKVQVDQDTATVTAYCKMVELSRERRVPSVLPRTRMSWTAKRIS
jgi:hypothetical protein